MTAEKTPRQLKQRIYARKSAERIRPGKKSRCPVCGRMVGPRGTEWPAPHLDDDNKRCTSAPTRGLEEKDDDRQYGMFLDAADVSAGGGGTASVTPEEEPGD